MDRCAPFHGHPSLLSAALWLAFFPCLASLRRALSQRFRRKRSTKSPPRIRMTYKLGEFSFCPPVSRNQNVLPSERSYRTLSIHVEDNVEGKGIKQNKSKREDPAVAIRNIDVHLISSDQVYTRFSTTPKVGLEASAVQRRAKLGKNVISPPPTHYWKKALNYVFGGFNFLMWIAFIVTIVRTPSLCGCS